MHLSDNFCAWTQLLTLSVRGTLLNRDDVTYFMLGSGIFCDVDMKWSNLKVFCLYLLYSKFTLKYQKCCK